MQFDRTKNSTRNFVFGLIYQATKLLMPFVIRTIIIYKLGNEYLGLSSLFTSVLSMLNMADLGFAAAVNFCLYKPIAEGKNEEAGALLNFLKNMYRLVGGVILTVGLALIPFLDKLISGDRPADMNIYVLYLVYLAQVVLSYFLFSFKNSVLNVGQRGDVLHKINTLVDLPRYILQILVLLLFADYYIYALLLPVGQIIINLCVNYYSNKIFPQIKPKGKIPKETKIIIFKKILSLAVVSITSRVSNSIGSIIISASLGLSAVALYGNYTYITSAILGVIMVGFSAVQSSVGNVIHGEGGVKTRETYKPLSFTAWWVSTVLCVCIFCTCQHFMTMWVGEEGLLSFFAMLWCCASSLIDSQRQFISMVYIHTAGVYEKTVLRQILYAIVHLSFCMILPKYFGVTGVLFATFISQFAVGLVFDYSILYKHILKLPNHKGIFEMLVKNFVSMLIGAVAYFVCSFIEIQGVWGFIVKGMIAASIAIIPTAVIMIRSNEMQFILGHIKQLLLNRQKGV